MTDDRPAPTPGDGTARPAADDALATPTDAGAAAPADPDRTARPAPPERDAAPPDVLAVALDLEALQPIFELQAAGQEGLLAEIVGILRQDGAAQLAALRDALARGDAEQARRLAHTLKGEALTCGATALADACRDAEVSARDGRLAEAAAALPKLKRLLEASLAALERLARTGA